MAKRRADAEIPGTATSGVPKSTSIQMSEYNALIDLQVKVRDRIGRPVSMLDAIAYSMVLFVNMSEKDAKFFGKEFDRHTAEAAQRKRDEQAEISRNAGKRTNK